MTSTSVVQSAEASLSFSKVRNLLSDDVYVHTTTPLTVYQFFASWCLGCSETMQTLEKYALPESGKDVSFRIVSIDELRSSGIEYYQKKIKAKVHKIQAVLWDPTLSLADVLKFDTIPYVVLVDAAGKVLWSRVGEMKESHAIDFKKILSSKLKEIEASKIVKPVEVTGAKVEPSPVKSEKKSIKETKGIVSSPKKDKK